MLNVDTVITAAREHGLMLYTGVPCSSLKPLINFVIDAPDLRYVAATNEGDAVAIAAGAALAGVGSVAMFQNSGLGNAANPLVSLIQPFQIPILLIVTWRGDPAGPPDEPQHRLTGATTPQMLELMQIPWEVFPTDAAALKSTLARACEHMRRNRTPYALIMRHGAVAPYALVSAPAPKPLPVATEDALPRSAARVTRNEVLRAIQTAARPTDALLTTTGYTSRELYALDDRSNQFYMVGSMGCVSSIGLGIALLRPERRVIVIDGDGAALMRLGALPTIGFERPANLIHVVLDNGSYKSTGGQATVAHSIDFCAVARASGYERVLEATTPDELLHILEADAGLTFVHVPIKLGSMPNLPRPALTPVEMARRFARFLEEH